MNFRNAISLTTTLAIIGFASLAQAQSLFSFATSSVGNEEEFGFNSGNISLDANFSGSGNPVTANANQSFSGLDGNGDSQTMTLSSHSFASAQYGILKAQANATISNSFYDSGNPWYWNPNTSEVNPDGVPDFFLVAGTASYTDIFTYTGLGAGFTVNFYYHIDGHITGDSAYTTLRVTNNGIVENFDVEADANGNVDQVFVTQKYAPNANSQITHTTQFTSGVSARVYEYDDGSNIIGEANFASTITLAGMVAYDANGDVFSNWSFTSGSGATYPVPEPAAMTILGVSALVALKRKKI